LYGVTSSNARIRLGGELLSFPEEKSGKEKEPSSRRGRGEKKKNNREKREKRNAYQSDLSKRRSLDLCRRGGRFQPPGRGPSGRGKKQDGLLRKKRGRTFSLP